MNAAMIKRIVTAKPKPKPMNKETHDYLSNAIEDAMPERTFEELKEKIKAQRAEIIRLEDAHKEYVGIFDSVLKHMKYLVLQEPQDGVDIRGHINHAIRVFNRALEGANKVYKKIV